MSTESVAGGTVSVCTVSFWMKCTSSVYFVMAPFLRHGSGGCHLIVTDVEDNTSIVTFVGLPSGATKV